LVWQPVIAKEASQTADVVLQGAQCRYADGTKAILTRKSDHTDYFVDHRFVNGTGEMVMVDSGAKIYIVSEADNGKTQYGLDTEPADVIAFGRVFAYLLTQPTTRISRSEFNAFQARQDVPACPWKTFDEVPGDLDLKDLVK
jgi:hypothetical protein